MQELLTYYTHQSPLSDPGTYRELFDPLPDKPDQLAEIVQGLLLHKLAAEHEQVSLGPQQRAEQRLRTVEERLERMISVDPAPLVQGRGASQRQVGVCRDFALLHVAMLRHKGIPARMRVGFAKYLDADGPYWIDHWISEYWHAGEERWVLCDAQLDPLMREQLGLPDDFSEVRAEIDFVVAGRAWRLVREGQAHSSLYRFNGHWKGLPCIRGNLLHDFQALNQVELGVYDYWDSLSTRSESELTPDDKALHDRIGRLCEEPDAHFEEMRALFESLPRTRQIIARLHSLGIRKANGECMNPAIRPEFQLEPPAFERLAARLRQIQPGQTGAQKQPEVSSHSQFDIPDDTPLGALQAIEMAGPLGLDDIIVRGARQHNLKHIDVRIPRNKLVVITGVSGSGKSSLAFDTIYAEGQRRYVESLSSYARQFMEQMEKPLVDQISGLSPAIAIEQKTISRNPRSTVGTVTEILDYLRVLFARLGTAHCPQCGQAVSPQSAQQITNQLAGLPAGTHFQLMAPVARQRKGSFNHILHQAVRDGYHRARIDGTTGDLSTGIPALDKNKPHTIELVIDRLVVPALEPGEDFRSRLMDSVETSLRAGQGTVRIQFTAEGEEILLSEHHACPNCELSFPELDPNLFSFNSPIGMCPECNGLGVVLQVDPQRIISQPQLSLLDGASAWYGNIRKKGEGWTSRNLSNIAEHYGVDLETPWNKLPEHFRHVLLYGSAGVRVRLSFEAETDSGTWRGETEREIMGIIYHINRLFRQTRSEGARRHYLQFMSQLPCPKCNGERICPEGRFVTVGGRRLPELTGYSIAALHDWVRELPASFDEEQSQVGAELVQEIQARLGFLRNVGLHYLTLDRPAPTLSGGEGQRIRLASQIGSGLVGVLYVLDEPSIGLHARDQRALLDTLVHLRNQGNTVLVVEHDAETMLEADWLIDLGPGAGILGGRVIAAGTPDAVMANPSSLTGQYLSGVRQVRSAGLPQRRSPLEWLTLRGAKLHNLKNIDVHFPLGCLVVVTGVSGSGKSSLIAQTLYPALSRILHHSQATPGPYERIEGLEKIDKVINITQEPIGRNPRSNPGTYVGALSEIRAVFASTPEARAAGYNPGRFSFNVKGGRCESCAGYGYKRVEMHFLPDVWVTCKECGGKRFNQQTLGITYRGKTIADVLEMDVQEALDFFAPYPILRRILQTLHDVGLDYIKLGQSALTLSGGEAQRVKLAKELSAVSTGRTVYILDEPTTGLHFADIARLLEVLERLVNAGNTVIIIEHNHDVIDSADWVIDLGPEGGEEGGWIVAEGAPEVITACKASHTGRALLRLYVRRKQDNKSRQVA
jgi:excinuclease ABC subunit A